MSEEDYCYSVDFDRRLRENKEEYNELLIEVLKFAIVLDDGLWADELDFQGRLHRNKEESNLLLKECTVIVGGYTKDPAGWAARKRDIAAEKRAPLYR